MFAVLRNGGKQYAVRLGAILKLEKIEEPVGSTITLDNVILLSNNGEITHNPVDVQVKANIIAHDKDDKVIIYKRRRRKHSQTRNGHRQNFTLIRVLSVE